jgi:death on curing protein
MNEREPRWIEIRDVIAIHDRLLAVHGGAAGLRDPALLESALARPRQHVAYSKPTDVIAMATLYTAGVIRNHPFLDGNKRAGFVIGVLFLELNGFSFIASEEDATRAVMDLAAGVLDEAAFETWLRQSSRSKRKRS